MNKLILSLLLLIFSSSNSFPQMSTFNGENLLNICNMERLACRAFITAVVDTTVLKDAADGIGCSMFKIPKNINVDQLKDIIIKNLNNNPKNSQQSGVFSVISIFHDAFPCP